jgi:formate dehydrogenase beta subunit
MFDGGYRLLNRLRSGDLKKEDLLKALDGASLRGLGGAGFPTGRKWRAVRHRKSGNDCEILG